MDKNRKLKDEMLNSIISRFNTSKTGDYYNFNLLPNLEEYNRADTVNMSPNEMNKFRHIAGTAQASKDISPLNTLFYGIGKEAKDLLEGQGFRESKYDMKNNLRGFKTYFQNPELEGDELNDYVFNNYIKPYRQ